MKRKPTLKRRMAWLAAAAGVAALLLAGTVWAQAGRGAPEKRAQLATGFTYQGQLTDNGSPVNARCDFAFALTDDASGGRQIGATDRQNAVQVVNGRFTVTLNAENAFGPEAFTGAARWLNVQVRCPTGSGEFSTLSPRQPLTAVPYAQSLLPGAVISGSVGSPTNAMLSLSNFDPNGVGLRVPDSGLDSIFIDRAGRTGISIVSTQDDGVFICTSGNQEDICGYHDPSVNGIEIGKTRDHGILIQYPGRSGLYVGEAGRNGVDVAGKDLAGYFYGAVWITGGCTGCNLVNFGMNTDTKELLPGDVVVLNGSQISRIDAVPVLMEVTQANGQGAVVGVVMGRAEEVTVDAPRPNEVGRRLIPREGAAKSGDFVTIITHGLAPVRVDTLSMPLAVGQRLTVAENGRARALQTVEVNGVSVNEAAPVLGMALETGDTDGDGLVWVLVNPQ